MDKDISLVCLLTLIKQNGNCMFPIRIGCKNCICPILDIDCQNQSTNDILLLANSALATYTEEEVFEAML